MILSLFYHMKTEEWGDGCLWTRKQPPPQLTTASLNFPDRTVRNKSLLFKSLPIYDSWLEQLKSAQTTPSIWVQNVKFVSH